jgi:antitoxin VapB
MFVAGSDACCPCMDITMIDLSQETEALARRVADARRVTVDAAVRQALEASAQAAGVLPEPGRPRDRSFEAVTMRRERIGRIVGEIAAMPVLDPRPPREIMDDLNAL